LKRYIGLRNIVTSKNDWKRTIIYEIDTHEEHEMNLLTSLFRSMRTSFVCYKTANGFHAVGLSPVTATQEGLWHDRLQRIIPEYFSGQTIRLSLKEGEKQELVDYSFSFPYLERLSSIYIKRFDIPKSEIPIYGEPPRYSAVFEKYWSEKI
jgi:hypothetical protein